MKTKLLITLLLTLSLALPVLGGEVFVWAKDSDDDVEKEIEGLRDKIEKYEKKIIELQGRAKTLANEIEYMDSQISLTELRIQDSIKKISQTEQKIRELIGDIEDLSVRIDKLQQSIDYQTEVLQSRLRARYKSKEDSPLVYLFDSNTFGQIVHKAEYLKTMEIQDNKLIDNMSKTKQSFTLQKRLFEDKKEKEEQLKNDLEVEKTNLGFYKSSLESQQRERENMLRVTKKDEGEYQKMLDAALRELNQIRNAANVVVREGNGVDVEREEVVGTMGNSGYSTGPHLHFGIYKYSTDDFQSKDGWDWYYSNYKNPLDKLKPKTVSWETGCYLDPSGSKTSGKGSWDWPMSTPVITQNYGSNTCYNWMYNGKPHPALDIISRGDISIRAVDGGEAYFCRNCLGDGGNGVFIFHDDGYMTLYWHLR